MGGGIGPRKDMVGAKYHLNISGREPSVPLAYVWVLEPHNPTMRILWWHVRQFRKERERESYI